MRYLGIDYGSKRVGLAFSDEAGTMGFPYSIIANTPQLVQDLKKLITKEHIGAVVIGDSHTLTGEANAIANEARVLGAQLREQAGVPISFESEVYTSAQARRAPGKEMKSREKQQRGAVDDSAAALILTAYLSRTHHE